MPHEIKLDDLPAGYALQTARSGDQNVSIAVTEDTSSEDGDLFISRLEGHPSEIVRRLPASALILPSSVDHLLAVVRPDKSVTVYVNECRMVAGVRAARAIQAGELVTEDDIVDIESLQFGVSIPADTGVMCVFSAGWRKGLFYDLAPLSGSQQPRSYDVERVLGAYYAYLTNQTLFKLDEHLWEAMFKERWFPFVTLPKVTVRRMLTAVREGAAIDEQLPELVTTVKKMAPVMRGRWAEPKLFEPHVALLVHALERFLADDYVSATAILYPRIEGLLRSMHETLGSGLQPSAKNLALTAVDHVAEERHAHSWLLPQRFHSFLRDVYFASFSSTARPVSRHSVAHGVAPAVDFDAKAALIGLLIVDQLRFLVPSEKSPQP